MNTLKSILILCSFVTSFSLNAQKFISGDESLSFLKGQNSLNLVFQYDNMLVGEEPEADYKKRRINEFNAKQKGKGERWAEAWVGNRTFIYEPKFEDLLTKVVSKEGIDLNVAKNQPQAKYTLIVKTKVTEPGWNAVVAKRNPYCTFDLVWIETASGKEMARAEMNKVPGVLMFESGWDFDPANNIKECYAKAGKMIGKKLVKALRA